MKKITLALMAVVVSCMFLTGCGSDVNAVKGGTLGEYKSTTVGEAFDNYSQFKSTSWKSFKTENGRKVVQFGGDLKIPARLKAIGTTKAVLVIQFIVNKDDTFEPTCVQIEGVEKGKKITANMSSMAEGIFAKIYANQPVLQ